MPPLSLLVKPVSGRCNMRCGYCFYVDEEAHRPSGELGAMSEQTLDNLIRRAFRYAEGGVYFAFQGGEPTLAGEEFYRQVIALEKRYNVAGLPVMNSIQTNGLALSDGLIELLARNNFLVGVSLDGPQEIHDRMRRDAGGGGTWARIRENISRLQAAGAQVNILCVVNKYAAQQPEAVFEALREYHFLQFIPCLDPMDGCAREYSLSAQDYGEFLKRAFRLYRRAYLRGEYVSVRAFDNYVQMLRGNPPDSCAMQGRCAPYYLVEADGSVYPCDFYALDEWKLGNINETGFERLARSPVGERFRQQSFTLPEACEGCEYYALCRGGCRRDRLMENGRLVNRYCAAYRSFFDACLPGLRALTECVR